jgi:hypothetical protein
VFPVRYELCMWDSGAGIATGYWQEGRGVGVQVPVGEDFSRLHFVQTGSGAHPVSYPMGTGALSPEIKATGGVMLTTHFNLVPRSRYVDLYINSLIHLHGVMLNLIK